MAVSSSSSNDGASPSGEKGSAVGGGGVTRTDSNKYPVLDDETAKALFTSLLFQWDPDEQAADERDGMQAREHEESSSPATVEEEDTEPNSEESFEYSPARNLGNEPSQALSPHIRKSPSKTKIDKTAQQEQQIAYQLEKLIPKDNPDALRETPLYQITYKAIQWQRDQYMISRDYAQWRQKVRQREKGPLFDNAALLPVESPSIEQQAARGRAILPQQQEEPKGEFPPKRQLPMSSLSSRLSFFRRRGSLANHEEDLDDEEPAKPPKPAFPLPPYFDTPLINRHLLPLMPLEEAGLAHDQLSRVGANFIPSMTVQKALLPLVVKLPATALYQPSQQGLLQIIHGQQANLNLVVKNRLLQFLSNPQNRLAIKDSTAKGLLTTASTSNNGSIKPPTPNSSGATS